MTVGPGDTDPLSTADRRRMLAHVDPEWRLVDAEPSTESSDAVYLATVADGETERRVVLKHPVLVEDDRFRREAALTDYVAANTSLPVPAVLGSVDEHDELPAPFFVMERREGVNPNAMDGDLDPDARDRAVREAGRHLAELHDLGPLSGFGWVAVEDGELTVRDPQNSWRETVWSWVEEPLSELADPFVDMEDDLRAALVSRIERLPDDVPAVPAHNDYRPGNLLVDAETGETRAVLDWGAAMAMHDEYELAIVEEAFCGPAPPDADERERVRSNLLAGYRERRPLDREALAERRGTYMLAYRVIGMHWFPYWYENTAESRRAEIVNRYREQARALLD